MEGEAIVTEEALTVGRWDRRTRISEMSENLIAAPLSSQNSSSKFYIPPCCPCPEKDEFLAVSFEPLDPSGSCPVPWDF